ncbi:MAG TPA: NAD(P)/FAD-dependent oxidoreductase [Cellulomonas sp.]
MTTAVAGAGAGAGAQRDTVGGHVEVAVLGAGFGGLGAAIRLQRAGRPSFLVLERAEDVGGTWRDNTYPGVACDIPSHLYSYSFRPEPSWSRVFAAGSEILDYLRRAAREEGVLDRVRFGAEVLAARWSEREEVWHLRTARGECTADSLVVAAGRLSEPRLPAIAGLDRFAGPVVHTARWPADLDVAGRRVAVVGTGASAVQLVPELARSADQVVVHQRSAPWVLPREDHPFSPAERAALADDPAALRALRRRLYAEAEAGFTARTGEPVALAALRARALVHLHRQVTDPGTRRMLTPTYEIGCKRVLFSEDWYPAITGPRTTLVPAAATRVEKNRVHAADGSSHQVDVLVLATGFQATRPPFAGRVRGIGGELLSAHWSQGMTSCASTVVAGFPQMFVLNGPNASLGHSSAIDMLEVQLDYLLGALDHRDARGGGALDVRAEAEADYTRELDTMSQGTVWLTGGCTSWYRDEPTGRLTLLWPGTATSFRARNGTFDPAAFQPARSTGSGPADPQDGGGQGGRRAPSRVRRSGDLQTDLHRSR